MGTSVIPSYICWRCGETHQELKDNCDSCGEDSVVHILELVDFANEMYLSGIVDINLNRFNDDIRDYPDEVFVEDWEVDTYDEDSLN